MDVFVMLLVNGLAEGALIFLMAAGLSVILGLMGIVNFSHGTMFLWGGYVSVWMYTKTGSFSLSLLLAMVVGFLMGLIFERFFIRPVYGKVTAQILITLGLMIVFTELVRVLWGPTPLAAVRPPHLAGTWVMGSIIISKYRVFLIVIGIVVALGIHALITRTRIGMIIRAGVQSPEMVQALGIDIRRYFSLVFAGGAALAAVGGALYVPLVGSVWSGMGISNQVLAFIVVVIGGMGSFIGSAVGSIFLGLTGALVAWYFPPAAGVVSVLLMALVLAFRPTGLFGLAVKS
ncbi:MAG: High-affinity branched-chain amino acid transport system permease protein LivH [Syntrophomonadaceae bacterium]|nr:High-affinity branched-chain amino acid transport system permease protein LivH [Bacillota bacterium]